MNKYFHSLDSRVVTAVNLRCFAVSVPCKIRNVVILPVSQFNGASLTFRSVCVRRNYCLVFCRPWFYVIHFVNTNVMNDATKLYNVSTKHYRLPETIAKFTSYKQQVRLKPNRRFYLDQNENLRTCYLAEADEYCRIHRASNHYVCRIDVLMSTEQVITTLMSSHHRFRHYQKHFFWFHSWTEKAKA